MIESGIKKEEYREVKPYWEKRLTPSSRYDTVVFHYGYTKRCLCFVIDDIHKGTGNPAWGAEDGKGYFVIGIGKLLWASRSGFQF